MMSEMMPEVPNDPFISADAQEIMAGLHSLYAAGIQAGFPEMRAFELVQGLFISQMAAVQAMTLSRGED
jgi:hypothetical protein